MAPDSALWRTQRQFLDCERMYKDGPTQHHTEDYGNITFLIKDEAQWGLSNLNIPLLGVVITYYKMGKVMWEIQRWQKLTSHSTAVYKECKKKKIKYLLFWVDSIEKALPSWLLGKIKLSYQNSIHDWIPIMNKPLY